MNNYQEFYNAIDEIQDRLRKDLIGASTDNEVLEDVEPLSTYVSGILYPKNSPDITDETEQIDEANINNDVEIEDALGADDDSINTANKYKPTSMGITFALGQDESKIIIRFSFGTYKHIEEQKILDNSKERTAHKYVRTQQNISYEFNVPSKVQTIHKRFFVENIYDVEIYLTLRALETTGRKLLTLTAVNNFIGVNKFGVRNEKALFQCELTASSEKGFLPVFNSKPKTYDIEQQITRALYKDEKNYACGHGCSVQYTETDNGVFSISSDFMPKEQVLQMMPGDLQNNDILSLKIWQTIEREHACKMLLDFIGEYEEWKESNIANISTNDEFYSAEKEIISRIEICIERLKNSVNVLKNNNNAWEAFRIMNEAMLFQRVNTKHCDDNMVYWYPFQLAYILQLIPDIADPQSEYRNYADLLWFPTGGGKTEAYLGAAAFDIFYRRLSKKPEHDGVTVIMRYTLRLLTIQQFERAAALICACEILRRKYNIPGGEISIGLWIGASMTPNNIADAQEALSKLRRNKDERIREKNPVQITRCPWCGRRIDVTGYQITNSNTMLIRCHDNPDCDFHKGLPIYVVDEDIYKKRPTLLLSTIDKFARIVWEERAKNLFGNGNMPPSLIIQDELHLISGALGSLAGAYETAVEYLCIQNGIAPKIIASTATVKNAPEQIKKLYNRAMLQFPPNGLSYKDSFFAHIAAKEERPARTYIGLCEQGNSVADLFVRTYAILTYCKIMLQKGNKSKEVVDQYYTIVGYFNAIRDLGSSSNILQSRMNTHLYTLVTRKFKELSDKLGIDMTLDRPSFRNDELTSRKNSLEIKNTLERLENNYTQQECYSYILASNMLSVGIDINRLGLMTVYSQPKSNSEYIQATSRVGRKNPGIVLVMYNPMRTRDRSHYEQFGFYHRTFYQYVESTSVTPFSVGALEKTLHGVFIAMVRHTVPGMSSNNSAGFFKDSDEIRKIIEFILLRINDTMPEAAEHAMYILENTMEIWEHYAKEYADLSYTKTSGTENYLLCSAESGNVGDFPPVLNSLRNVEQSAEIYLEG